MNKAIRAQTAGPIQMALIEKESHPFPTIFWFPSLPLLLTNFLGISARIRLFSKGEINARKA